MTDRKIARVAFFIVLPLALVAYLSNQGPENVLIKVCSSFDGKPVVCKVVIVDRSGQTRDMTVMGENELSLPVGEYKINVESEGYTDILAPVIIEPQSHQHIDVGLVPDAQVFGKIRNGATDKPIPGVQILAVADGKVFRTMSDQEGIYSISVPKGDYVVETANTNLSKFSGKYLLTSGQRIVENIYLLPADMNFVSLSEYVSYACTLKRKGNIAGFPQNFDVSIKRNPNGDAHIRQTFSSNEVGGQLDFVLLGDKGFFSDGTGFKPLVEDGFHAAKLILKTNEQLFDLINSFRFDTASDLKELGVEKASGVKCKKIQIKTGQIGTWVGKSAFDVTLWVMDEGKLKGTPTRINGTMEGYDEQSHGFYLELDMNVTDVGTMFKMPEITQ